MNKEEGHIISNDAFSHKSPSNSTQGKQRQINSQYSEWYELCRHTFLVDNQIKIGLAEIEKKKQHY